MENRPCHNGEPEDSGEGIPVFRVLIAYKDLGSGSRAMELCQSLVEDLGHEFQFRTMMWQFDSLSIPKTREMAIADAASADMIIISTSGERRIPEAVRRWVESWIPRKREMSSALVALMDEPVSDEIDEEPTHAAPSYLREAAERSNMDFFVHEARGWRERNLSLDNLNVRAQSTSSVLEEILHHRTPVPHWGLNE